MTLPELSIKRPVFATVLSLVLVLVGLVSYDRLSVREYPAIDPPVVTVQTTYPGASAAIVETQVTQVLEDSLAGIEGIDFLTSISRQELSQITITFKLDRNPDYAAADVRDRVGRVRGRLPEEIEEPIIQKVEADAQPIMYLAFSSASHIGTRNHRLRRPLCEGSASDAVRRCRGPIIRRARIFHAHLARSRAPRRLPVDAAGRRSGAQASECRGAVRPHREPAARVHRAGGDGSAHARPIQRSRDQGSQRLSRAPVRRGPRRAGGAR